MISPTKQAETVLVDGLSGERRQFTIKATGKAFRTLIDGLYSNKIGALVRELVSNGYDSHAVAQLGDVPVTITAPTNLDPIFKVRDYGVSMDHDTIMDLYSTIFESSKESSNDQVGMFGLGSKSPFAYTDSFTVTAFQDGLKRVYVAHIANGDIPQITFTGSEPADEPRGIEVTVPVQPHDIRTFHHEIKRNVLAAAVTPVVDGMADTSIPEPLAQGDGWRIYDDEYGIGRVGIRQGCVIYPLHNMAVQAVSYGYSVVVDVPIGTVDVTASRESLSLTPETTTVVREALAEVDAGIREWAKGITFKNRLDAFQKNKEYGFLSFSVGQHRINLVPDKPSKTLPAQSFTYFKSARKTGVLTQTDDPHRWTFLVERDDEKVLRKNLRIAAYFKSHGGKHLGLVNARDLPRLQRVLGLSAEQVVPVATLPDVAVVRTNTGGYGGWTRTGPSTAAPKKMPPGTFWVPKEGINRIDVRIGNFYCGKADELGSLMDWSVLGFTSDLSEVIYLTEKQAKALGAPKSRLFTDEVAKRAEKYVKRHNFQAKLDQAATEGDLQRYVRNIDVRSMLTINRYDYAHSQLTGHLNTMAAAAVLNALAPTGKASLTASDLAVRPFVPMTGNSSLQTADADAKVKEVVAPFVGLFKTQDPVETLLKFYSENK